MVPKSGCIPFQVMEYSLGLEKEIKDELDACIEKLNSVQKVKKMNRLLYRCKELVGKLKFHGEDPCHLKIRDALIGFGIPESQLK